ncbi:MAG: hypothetical protein MUC68_08040 [Burkholderiaceae bacterium]|nr:hypothetical protein [Burkholderiaceae bacterium]
MTSSVRLMAVAGIVALAGCATPPDGSRIQRLPDGALATPPVAPAAAIAPTLSPEQQRELTALNARLLAEQEQARAREDALAAQRQRDAQVYWGLQWGWGPGWHHRDWLWTGSRWVWRPRWGVELWGPWGY